MYSWNLYYKWLCSAEDKKSFIAIINMTYSCRVRHAMIHTEREKMKIDRLIGILSILLQNEKTTAPELAEQFEVSRRP